MASPLVASATVPAAPVARNCRRVKTSCCSTGSLLCSCHVGLGPAKPIPVLVPRDPLALLNCASVTARHGFSTESEWALDNSQIESSQIHQDLAGSRLA